MVTKRQIEAALKKAIDPETGVSLLEMGLIKEIKIEKDIVKIRMTLTTPFCPLAGYLVKLVKQKAEAVKEVKRADVELFF